MVRLTPSRLSWHHKSRPNAHLNQTSQRATDSVNTYQRSVLVVEDHDDTRLMLRTMLELRVALPLSKPRMARWRSRWQPTSMLI